MRTAARRLRATRDSGATRRALVAAATDLFAERGFKGATTDSIARRAGVNKAMINYHFRTKKQLYEAILADTFAELSARIALLLKDERRPAHQLLCDFAEAFGEVATRSPRFAAMLLRELVSGGELMSRDVRTHISAVLGAVFSIVERGVREGSLRPVDPLLTHLSLVGSLVFFFATTAFRERMLAEGRLPAQVEPPTAARYVRHLQELFTRGLGASPAEPGVRRI